MNKFVLILSVLFFAACSNQEEPKVPTIEEREQAALEFMLTLPEDDYAGRSQVYGTLATIVPGNKEYQRQRDLLAEKAQEQIKQKEIERQERVAASLSKLKKTYDKVQDIEFYHDKSGQEKKYTTGLYAYLGKKKSGELYVCSYFRYYGDNWVFADRIVVVAGDVRHTYVPRDWLREVGGGSVWEIAHECNSESTLVLSLIGNSSGRETIVSYQGRYRYDHKVTEKEKAAIKNVLDAFMAATN